MGWLKHFCCILNLDNVKVHHLEPRLEPCLEPLVQTTCSEHYFLTQSSNCLSKPIVRNTSTCLNKLFEQRTTKVLVFVVCCSDNSCNVVVLFVVCVHCLLARSFASFFFRNLAWDNLALAELTFLLSTFSCLKHKSSAAFCVLHPPNHFATDLSSWQDCKALITSWHVG